MKKILEKFLSVMLTFVFAASAFAATQTIIVTGNTSSGENLPGWYFGRDVANQTPFAFNTGNASIGFGSLYVSPIDGSVAARKFIGENFINMPIADINSISTDFRLGGPTTSTGQFYINVYANFGVSDPLKFYDCRYEVIASTGSPSGFTTITFDPTQPYPVTTRGGTTASPFTCPAIPANMNGLSAGSNMRMFSINLGDTSANDAGMSGYFDKVVVSTVDGATTYDFEPVLTPTNMDQCKKGGWMNFNTPVFVNQGDCVSFVQSNNPTP